MSNSLDKQKNQAQNQADERHLQHWRNIQTIANAKLAEYQTIGKDGKPDFKKLSVKDLKDIVKSMREAVMGERVVLGLPNNVSATEQKIKVVDEFVDFTEEELAVIAESSSTLGEDKPDKDINE